MPSSNPDIRRKHYREWYRKDPANREKVLEKNRRRRAANKQFIREYLESHPCVDCGESDIVVLDFDHLGDKFGHVTTMANNMYSIARLEAEIEKCEVVCANCHRRRTAQRRDH